MTNANCNASSTLKSRKDAAIYLGIKAHTLAVWACTNRYALPTWQQFASGSSMVEFLHETFHPAKRDSATASDNNTSLYCTYC